MEIKEQIIVALVQFDIVWELTEANCMKIERMIGDLKQKSDIIVLPEAFNTGFSTNSKTIVENHDGVTINWMKRLSYKYNSVICGSIFVNEDGKNYNRFYWVEPNGNIQTYDKRHLFSMGNEDQFFSRGNKPVIIEHKGWKIFPQICYDLRFPVWSRNIHGYDLLINVANWPASRREVWKILLKARAIENQCYVVAVNRIGVDGNKIEYSGDSLLVDPKGIKMFKAQNKEMIEAVVLEYGQLVEFRKKFNTLRDIDEFILTP